MTNKLPFSPIRKAGNLIFTSGQIHLTTEGKLLEGTIKEKTHQVMKNLQKLLEKENLTFDNVVKTNIYLTNMADYGDVNKVYMEYFDEVFPAREAIGIRELPLGASIEISMIAQQ